MSRNDAYKGIAACNIGGVTVHSFAGIGLGIEPAEDLVVKIKKNKKSATRWARTKVLIIDEGIVFLYVAQEGLAYIYSSIYARR